MHGNRFRRIAEHSSLLFGSLLLSMLALEVLYRVLDPFPYFTEEKINSTEYGNLTTFDETLGWKGVANGMGEFVTQNNRVRLTHNRQGNRDVEHEDVSTKKPAIVFLGDSFTWGHEVEFDEMFVNRLRDRLPAYEIFNLAQRGYGTDQELISFRNWADSRQLRLVALVFCENDIEDNNSEFRYDKPKPRYRLKNDALVLTGVPLPRVEAWTNPRPGKDAPESWLRKLPKLLFHSHLLHDLYLRCAELHSNIRGNETENDRGRQEDLTITARLLGELKREVEGKGAQLVVVFIPSKAEIEGPHSRLPYQSAIAGLCRQLGIRHFDLGPTFRKVWFRTYYRLGTHWNPHGHKVASEALYAYLTTVLRS